MWNWLAGTVRWVAIFVIAMLVSALVFLNWILLVLTGLVAWLGESLQACGNALLRQTFGQSRHI